MHLCPAERRHAYGGDGRHGLGGYLAQLRLALRHRPGRRRGLSRLARSRAPRSSRPRAPITMATTTDMEATGTITVTGTAVTEAMAMEVTLARL
jgi:hypothetical protein